ncbi:MAG: hypothetical protein H0Z39_03560 [Peptococcaceae bacterium]|nr:hypothetical protein [Peptococcaceae bacterium]
MAKRTYYLITGLIILSLLGIYFLVGAHQQKQLSPLRNTVNSFCRAVAARDFDRARQLSCGPALQTISQQRQLADKLQEARVIDLRISEISIVGDTATLTARVERELTGGENDVSIYDIGLYRAGSGWKIYRFEPAAPAAKVSLFGGPSQDDWAAAKDVYICYLTALSRGNWDAAEDCLVGLARQEHRSVAPVYGQHPLLQSFENVQIDPQGGNREVILAKMTYQVDGSRTVKTLTTFQRTAGGWKIAAVSSLDGN